MSTLTWRDYYRTLNCGNISVPQLQSGYESRKEAIQKCVGISKQEVQRLRQENEAAADSDSLEPRKKLRAAQTKVSLRYLEQYKVALLTLNSVPSLATRICTINCLDIVYEH